MRYAPSGEIELIGAVIQRALIDYHEYRNDKFRARQVQKMKLSIHSKKSSLRTMALSIREKLNDYNDAKDFIFSERIYDFVTKFHIEGCINLRLVREFASRGRFSDDMKLSDFSFTDDFVVDNDF